MSFCFVFLIFYLLKNILGLKLGVCNPPSLGSGTECKWDCRRNLCQGVYYCGPNSTKCEMNCEGQHSCNEPIALISQSKGDTTVNCTAPQGSCKRLLINCGDFDNNIIGTLRKYGFNGLFNVLNDLAVHSQGSINGGLLMRNGMRLNQYFTKKPGQYKKCVLNCGGEADNCEKSLFSCNGKFDTGCTVNTLNHLGDGLLFKGSQFYCSIKNDNHHHGSCFLNCPKAGHGDVQCIDTLFACRMNLLDPQMPIGTTLGKCYCFGEICTDPAKQFLSNVINTFPIAPTLPPRVLPAHKPNISPGTKIPITIDPVLDIYTVIDRKRLFGINNDLICNSIKCEIRCYSEGACNNLIIFLPSKVLYLFLLCESPKSCVNLQINSNAVENKIECKGRYSCNGARFNFGKLHKMRYHSNQNIAVEIICQGGSCETKTEINCGENVSECRIQSDPHNVYSSFGGVVNCYSKHGVCDLHCSDMASGNSCVGSRYNCFANINQCICSPFAGPSDCPKINQL